MSATASPCSVKTLPTLPIEDTIERDKASAGRAAAAPIILLEDRRFCVISKQASISISCAARGVIPLVSSFMSFPVEDIEILGSDLLNALFGMFRDGE
jgi:hypothetical protein